MSGIRPVILCGGSGTRLWPLSRELYPKQFMALGQDTLFGRTLKRVGQIEDIGRPIVVCNIEHRFFAAGIMQELGVKGDIILEPEARNTAPAIALAALAARSAAGTAQDLQAGGPGGKTVSKAESGTDVGLSGKNESSDSADPLLLVLPSDHEIEPVEIFRQTVLKAAAAAEQGFLLTFGVKPLRPESGFGYIRSGAECAPGVHKVAQFVEKPNLEKALEFIESGEYTWNSGMFMFKASLYLDELGKHAPKIKEACEAAWAGHSFDRDFIRVDGGAFAASPSDSIDYAVMEHTSLACVASLDANWNDLGSWRAFYEASPHDAAGNAVIGDVLTHDVQDCYLHAGHKLLAVVGVRNLAVVDTADAVLVMDLERAQEVKAIFNMLKKSGRSEVDAHIKVYRPWGHYSILASSERFQVKSIVVKPGARLSMQLHHHRAEHWVVVRGTAKVIMGEESRYVGEDESTYIPLGTRHSLENPGKIPLEIIEVQTGSYLGEDDIVRFEDIYGRLL